VNTTRRLQDAKRFTAMQRLRRPVEMFERWWRVM
jgi:hypothetical protein